MMLEQIAKRLKQLRLAYDYSGAYVADEIDYSANQLWLVEKGTSKPNIEFVANICTFYGISIDTLVFGSDVEFQKIIDKLFKTDKDDELIESMERLGYGRANSRWHRKAEQVKA